MKRLKIAVSLIMSASLLSPTVFAKNSPLSDTYNWTGFYAGLNAGALKHTMNMTDNQATSFLATIQQTSDPYFSGGLQVGYRHQVALRQATGIYGLELSVNFSNAEFNQTFGSPYALYQLNATNNLKHLGLFQFIGGIAADNTLLFFAAGLSQTDIHGNVTNTAGIPFFNSFNVNKKPVGTALGAGIEYAFSEKFSARFKVDVITPNVYSTSDELGDIFQISNNIVQGVVGVNYKFG